MRLRERQFRRQIRELDNHQSSRSRIDQDEFEIRRKTRIIKFKTLESKIRIENSKFEKSNSAMKFEKSNSTTNSNRNSRSRIEQDNENFDDKFESKFEKSNRATKRKRRIRNSTSKYDTKIQGT